MLLKGVGDRELPLSPQTSHRNFSAKQRRRPQQQRLLGLANHFIYLHVFKNLVKDIGFTTRRMGKGWGHDTGQIQSCLPYSC